MFTYDGALIHLAALVNVNADTSSCCAQFFPRPAGRDTAVTRAIATGKVCIIDDVLDRSGLQDRGRRRQLGGFRSVLAVPLLRDGKAIGGSARPAEYRARSRSRRSRCCRPSPTRRSSRSRTCACSRSSRRARRSSRARSHELSALGEVGQAVSSTLDLETVLSTIVARATQLTGMDGGSIYEYDEAREEFHLHATDRLPDDLVDALRATPIRKGEGALGRLADHRRARADPRHRRRRHATRAGSAKFSCASATARCSQCR